MTRLLFAILSGYLLGSISFPQLMARWRKGLDLREVGSRSVGGMNAMRNVGWGWGFLAGVGDFAKGLAALAAARLIGAPEPYYLLAGLAALAGHNYPVWLGFRGGKGVAVGLGLALWAAPLAAATGFVVGLPLYVLTGNILIAAATGFLLMLGVSVAGDYPPEVPWLIVGVLLLMGVGILPEGIRLLRTPGGLRDYFQDPIRVYRQGEEDSQPQ